MRINKIFDNIAKSKTGQKIIGWATQPKGERFFNNTLPTLETAVTTGIYIWSTAKQDIPKQQKEVLQWQNVLSGVAGMVVGSVANRWISKKSEEIIKDLDPQKINQESMKTLSRGIRVLAPLATTCLLMRLIMPVAVSSLSSDITHYRMKKSKKNLDVKA